MGARKIYVVVRTDQAKQEHRMVAAFGSEEDAERYCIDHNARKIGVFHRIGEVLYFKKYNNGKND